MQNPRDYAAPGNQDPATPWPDSIVLAAAIAAATSELRVALAAVIAPLRHPLLLAKQLATLDLLARGRLVVQPTVSWAGRGVRGARRALRQRGAILDEQLEAMHAAWTQTPAAFTGAHFRFADVYCEPKPYRPEGPRMWFGGQALHPALLRRIVRYGSGFHPFGSPTDADLARLRRGDGGGGQRRRRARARRRDPRPLRGCRTASPISTRPSPACRPSFTAASRRSASSRRCSPTTATRSPTCAAGSSSASAADAAALG